MGQEIDAVKTDMTHMNNLCASKSGPYDCIGSNVISIDSYVRPLNNLFTKASILPPLPIAVSHCWRNEFVRANCFHYILSPLNI